MVAVIVVIILNAMGSILEIDVVLYLLSLHTHIIVVVGTRYVVKFDVCFSTHAVTVISIVQINTDTSSPWLFRIVYNINAIVLTMLCASIY